MKKIVLLIGLLKIISGYANQEQENFLRAQELAGKGHYEEAIVLYNTITKPGFLIWYNKGVCYYHLNTMLEAYVAFKKAEYYADKSTYKILKAALRKTAEKGNYPCETFWYQKIVETRYYIPLIVIQIFFILSLLGSVWYSLKKNFSWKLYTAYFFVIVQAIYIGIIWYGTTRAQAVVINTVVSHVGPGEEYQSYKEFVAGSVVIIDKKEKNWYKIKRSNNIGWVEETAVNVIEH